MAMRVKYGKLFGGDKSLWSILVILAVASILVIYSSTASMAYKLMDGDTGHYLIRQIRFVLVGFLFTYIFHLFDYQFYLRMSKPLFAVTVLIMSLTFFGGVNYNDASRWLRIPFSGFTFQPSDILKITLMIMLASQLAKRQKIIDRIPLLPSFYPGSWKRNSQWNMNILFNTTLPVLGPIALVCFMVLFSNFSTSAIIFIASLVVLIIGRVRWKEIARLLMITVIALIFSILVFKMLGVGRVDTWVNRITSFAGITQKDETTPDADKNDGADVFQVEQAKIAIASGWLLGKGPGKSTQRTNLPHPYSDYAYAFIIEEYGIAGAVFILWCYLWIFYRAIVIFRKCQKVFPSLMVLGLSLMITMQALINMAVATDLLPVTGQTLPLISLGGSSLVFTSISLGMILGVSRQLQEQEELRQLELNRQHVEEWGHIILEQPENTEKDDSSPDYDGVILKM